MPSVRKDDTKKNKQKQIAGCSAVVEGHCKFPLPRALFGERDAKKDVCVPSSPSNNSEESSSPACLSSAETANHESCLHGTSAKKKHENAVGRKVVYTGSVAGLLKMKYRQESESTASEDMLKVDAMEAKVKALFEDVATCINEVQGADLTMKGFQVLGNGLRVFALLDDSEDGREKKDGSTDDEEGGSKPRSRKQRDGDSRGSSEILSCEGSEEDEEDEDGDEDEGDDDFCAGSTSCEDDEDEDEDSESEGKGSGESDSDEEDAEDLHPKLKKARVDTDESEEEEEVERLCPKSKKARVDTDESEEEEEVERLCPKSKKARVEPGVQDKGQLNGNDGRDSGDSSACHSSSEECDEE
jgi:hypothetical protein